MSANFATSFLADEIDQFPKKVESAVLLAAISISVIQAYVLDADYVDAVG